MSKVKNNWHSIIIILLLGLFVVLGRKVTFLGTGYKFEDNVFSKFTIADFGIYLLSILFLGFGIYLLRWGIKKISCFVFEEKERSLSFLKLYAVAAILIVMWIPWYLHLFPGVLTPDSLSCVTQIETNSLNNHHPILYTLLLKIFYVIGKQAGNVNFGVALFSAAQSIVLALTLSMTVIRVWQRGARLWVVIVLVIIYAVTPLFPIYGVNVQKDTLFSCSLVWFTLWITKHREEEHKMTLKEGISLFVLALLPCLLRNNGIYILLAMTVVLVLFYKKNRIRYFGVFGTVIISFFLITKVLYPATGVKEIEDKRETYGLLLQQTAYVICNDGEMKEEDKEVLFKILPEEDWKEAYQPSLADTIKWNSHFDNDYFSENSDLFLKTWFSLLLKNPVDYVKAYSLDTFGFWKWGVQEPDCAYADTGIWDNEYGLEATDYTAGIWNGQLSEFLDNFQIVIGSGSLLWIILILLAVMPMERFGKMFLLALPALGNWATIIVATPIAFSMRYVYIFVLITPMIVVTSMQQSCPPAAWKKEVQNSECLKE